MANLPNLLQNSTDNKYAVLECKLTALFEAIRSAYPLGTPERRSWMLNLFNIPADYDADYIEAWLNDLQSAWDARGGVQ